MWGVAAAFTMPQSAFTVTGLEFSVMWLRDIYFLWPIETTE
jgi:hypothetical protein